MANRGDRTGRVGEQWRVPFLGTDAARSWVLRTATVPRECADCGGPIPEQVRYYLMDTGERLCEDCCPDLEGECPLGRSNA